MNTNQWEPERDWSKIEFDARWEEAYNSSFRTQQFNSSAPYQDLAQQAHALFVQVASELRYRVRDLLGERFVGDDEPSELAEYLIDGVRSTAVRVLNELNAAYGARGASNLQMVAAPVRMSKTKIFEAAKSISMGIAEDFKARQRAEIAEPRLVVSVKSTSKGVGEHSKIQLTAEPAPGRAAKKRVFTLHGIRTHGEWQKEVAEPLAEEDFIPKALGYGYFRAWRLLATPTRRSQIEWFHKRYHELVRAGDLLPHIIAHSFGTYIVAEAMRKYPEIKFDHIIFCGSIVEREFDWAALLQRGQYRRILNEIGGKDFPVWLAPHFVSDAGDAGKVGFNSPSEAVVQNINLHFGHSDVLYAARVTRLWVPFLRGECTVPDLQVRAVTHNSSFRNTWRVALAGIFIFVTIFLIVLKIWSRYANIVLNQQPDFKAASPATSSAESPTPTDESSDATRALVKPRFAKRLTLSSDGATVLDTRTSLRWTVIDSGINLKRADADRYCQAFGVGWHVPSIAELRTLATRRSNGYSGTDGICRESDGICWVPSGIYPSGEYVWSSGPLDPDEYGVYYDLRFRLRRSYTWNLTREWRTLCVVGDL